MKNIYVALIIIIIGSLCILCYYGGYHDGKLTNEYLVKEFYQLSLHQEELLDMYYEHDSNFYLDVINETDSYQEYYKLRIKLLNE